MEGMLSPADVAVLSGNTGNGNNGYAICRGNRITYYRIHIYHIANFRYRIFKHIWKRVTHICAPPFLLLVI